MAQNEKLLIETDRRVIRASFASSGRPTDGTAMIIDTHVHLLRQQGYEHHLAKAAREAGIDKMALMGGPNQYDYASNDQVIAAAERYPDLFIPFAYFRLGRDYPAMVDEFRSRAFHGLQFAVPEGDYDDKEYYLVYARAGQLGMPALFQLGLLPNSGRDHLHNVCCRRMRPICLDTIARAFPELTLIGTRLGNPWYEEACEVARCNANVYLDLSGTTLKKKGPEFFSTMLWWDEADRGYTSAAPAIKPWRKILFGSDVHYTRLSSMRDAYENLMNALDLDSETRRDVMALNAVRALGLEY